MLTGNLLADQPDEPSQHLSGNIEQTCRTIQSLLKADRERAWELGAIEDRSSAPLTVRESDLADVDAALERLRQRGLQQTESYMHLTTVRQAIADGAPYRKLTWTPAILIAALGGQIATLNHNTKGERLPGRRQSRLGVCRKREHNE